MEKSDRKKELIISSFRLRKFSPSQTLEAGFNMNRFLLNLVVASLRNKEKDTLKAVKSIYRLRG